MVNIIKVQLDVATGQALTSLSQFRTQATNLIGQAFNSASVGGLAGGAAGVAAAAYAGAVTDAIGTVRNAVSFSLDQLTAQLPNLYGQAVDRVKEAMDAEGERLGTANTIRISSGKSLAESGAIGLDARRELADKAAVLPGEAKDYNTIFAGSLDNFSKALKASGITDTKALIDRAVAGSVQLGVVQSTSGLTSTDMSDFLNRFLGSGDIKRLEKSRFGKTNPILLSLMEDSIISQGSTLKDAGLKERLKAFETGMKLFLTKDYIDRAKLSLNSSLGAVVSKLIDPEIGIFSFARILNPNDPAAKKDFTKAKTALDGVKAVMAVVAALLPKSNELSFDIMSNVRQRLFQLSNWLRTFGTLFKTGDFQTNAAALVQNIVSNITKSANTYGPIIVKGLKAAIQFVVDFLQTDGYKNMRKALMGLYDQIQDALNGPAMRSIMAEVLSVQMEMSIKQMGRNFNVFFDVATKGFINMLGDGLKYLGQLLYDALIGVGKLIKLIPGVQQGIDFANTPTVLPAPVGPTVGGVFDFNSLPPLKNKAGLSKSVSNRQTNSTTHGPVTVNVHPSKGMDEQSIGKHVVREIQKHQQQQKRKALG